MLRLAGLVWLGQATEQTCFAATFLNVRDAWSVREADTGSWDYTRQALHAAGCISTVLTVSLPQDSSWGQLCVGHFQSPIDIEPKHALKGALPEQHLQHRARLRLPGDFEIRMLYRPLRLQESPLPWAVHVLMVATAGRGVCGRRLRRCAKDSLQRRAVHWQGQPCRSGFTAGWGPACDFSKDVSPPCRDQLKFGPSLELPTRSQHRTC